MATGECLMLQVLPWEDVIFKSVLSCLPLKSLFYLRASCKQWKMCVEQYFTSARVVRIINTGPRFSLTHFEIIIKNTYNIRTLFIRDANGWLSDTAIIPVIVNNPSLETVDLSGNTSITDKVPHSLASACADLREITLRECNWLSDSALNRIAMNCERLERLDISGCWNITDSSLRNVATLLVNLKFLSIAKIYGLTDVSVALIARNLPRLEHINLQGCWRVTDESIFLLGEYCKQLRKLQVRECRDVSLACMQKLADRGVVVDVLHNSGRPRLTSNHLASLLKLPM